MWTAVIITAWIALGYMGGRLTIKYNDEEGWTGLFMMLVGPFGLLVGALAWQEKTGYQGPDFNKMLRKFFNVKD